MCIFCDIIKGDLPSYKIYEDEFTYAFLSIGQEVEGHTLVIPKNHCVNVLDASNKDLGHVMDTVKKISNHYLSLGYTGVNILNASGVDAQQSVMHLHFHIMPRKTEDGIDAWPKFNKVETNLENTAKKLKLN